MAPRYPQTSKRKKREKEKRQNKIMNVPLLVLLTLLSCGFAADNYTAAALSGAATSPTGERRRGLGGSGLHLGHNIPDRGGDRYCIDLVCIAGQPLPDASEL